MRLKGSPSSFHQWDSARLLSLLRLYKSKPNRERYRKYLALTLSGLEPKVATCLSQGGRLGRIKSS